MNEELLRQQFGEMGKFVSYLETEYRYSLDDLLMLHGNELYDLFENMMHHELLDPQTSDAEQLMKQAIDNFMTDSSRRRRRSY